MGEGVTIDLPLWWEWELGFTAHLEERMLTRDLSEIELRTMLEAATEIAPARRPGRWIVSTRHAGSRWIVVVEPDQTIRKLMVVTAYSTEA